MKACQACGLKTNAENYSGHNCYEVIKQIGRSELASEILSKIKDLPDVAPLGSVRATLQLEEKRAPKVELEDLAATA